MYNSFFHTFANENKTEPKKKLYYYEKNNKVHHVRSSYDDDEYDSSMFK